MAGKPRADRPSATNWEKSQALSDSDRAEFRDVHESQQFDRGKMAQRKSTRPGTITGIVVGSVVGIVVWFGYTLLVVLMGMLGPMMAGGGTGAPGVPSTYYAESIDVTDTGETVKCWQALDENQMAFGTCYRSTEEVPVPEWYTAALAAAEEAAANQTEPVQQSGPGFVTELFKFDLMKLYAAGGLGAVVGFSITAVMNRRVLKENVLADTSDINQHENDAFIALPEEIMRKFEWFPDAGAHSSVEANSMISHIMIQRKGIKSVPVTRVALKDEFDAQGELVYAKGEVKYDEGSDEPAVDILPLIDEEFGTALFDASGLPNDPALRTRYSASAVPSRVDGYKTMADEIAGDWDFPSYEVQRPAGAYLVDSAPVNTMVLAMTRAGKGQTYIEPMIDMWSREKRKSNMVLNDPKGELLVKNYVKLVYRGYEVWQYNLINAVKTDIYNPLGMAAEAALEGEPMKCALYVENIADVFFPTDGGEDPVWPNAANNAFKRAAYAMIDFYCEEERQLREYALSINMDPAVLENRLDDLWGKVTLYNTYQMFVQLSSKKVKNPEAELKARVEAGEFDNDEAGLEAAMDLAERQAPLFEGKPEQDMLTLYFNATDLLPKNRLRTLLANANNALKAMAGAERMLASVYGIAITAMSFFTDPTISTLTSGKPSQNTDLGGMSFPRRFGVRFSLNYAKRDSLIGLQAKWSAYSDPMFLNSLGSTFEHSDMVTREGWARYYFEGIFPEEQSWVKLELRNPQTGMLVRSFFFSFMKAHQVSLSGRHYVTNPVTDQKIVKNGLLRELRPVRKDGKLDGEILSYALGDTTYPQERLNLEYASPQRENYNAHSIQQITVRYSEQPKAVFLVTPPHMTKYAKLILILIKQLVDLNFDKSYMTKENQKPLYRTRFMLDEVGNLQSEGHGISGLETKLSIGLGQEQQFTLILQTLQQIRDVYGESADKIIQGNVSNIVFLKSTDDTMLKTLETMSGTTHRSSTESKQISRDVDKMFGSTVDARVSYTTSTKEEPLIKYNDLNLLPERNSIVFSAGKPPVWNRNATILPMSYRLNRDNIVHPGRKYTLQTIPTMSSALEFDVGQNQPDFAAMLEKRIKQAIYAEDARQTYAGAYGYSDMDVARLDPDIYADDVMRLIDNLVNIAEGRDAQVYPELDGDEASVMHVFSDDSIIENTLIEEAIAAAQIDDNAYTARIFAEGTVSREMLVRKTGEVKGAMLDREIIEAYASCEANMHGDRDTFTTGSAGELCSLDGGTVYIRRVSSAEYAAVAAQLNAAAGDPDSRIFADGDIDGSDLAPMYEVTPAFYAFLAEQDEWRSFADGEFDRFMSIAVRRRQALDLAA